MKLKLNDLGIYELTNNIMDLPEEHFIVMDLTDLIDSFKLIRDELNRREIKV